jgi:hypothetical protein
MPLSESSLVMLNQLNFINSQDVLGSEQDDFIKDIFKKIFSSGDVYTMTEIEHYLAGNPKANPVTTERFLNVAHYQKAKFDAKNPLKLASDSCGCGGEC